MTRRLVAVLGYSNGGSALHEICEARLRRAELEARPGDVVLFSGWSRRRGGRSEAELMAESWRGPDVDVVVGRDARTTFGNATDTARAAAAHGVDEVLLVTSSWHAPRAVVLVRAALAGTGVQLRVEAADGTAGHRVRLRERACGLLTPAQARVLRARFGGGPRVRSRAADL